jgi:hypothetical protein
MDKESAYAPLGKFAKKFKMLQMHKFFYESHLKFWKQKFIPMHLIPKASP